MTILETIRSWLMTWPGQTRLHSFRVDYTDAAPNSGGIRPQGLTEQTYSRDILGNLTVENRYIFGLYYVLEKAPGDDPGAEENALWLLELQNWVQAQCAAGLAPQLGDDPARQHIRLENGVLYAADDEGTATYRATLSVRFVKHYEGE